MQIHVRKPVAVDGKGVDIASGGIWMELPQAIAEGSALDLDLPDGGAPLAGTVRMVPPLPGGGFPLGVQLSQEDRAIVARARALAST